MKKSIIIILFIVIICFEIIGIIPVKRAVKIEENGEDKEDEFICEFIAMTGPSWRIRSIASYEWEEVYLEDNNPIKELNKNNFFFFSNNTFWIQGECIGERMITANGEMLEYYYDDKTNGEEWKTRKGSIYKIIKVIKWEIVEPINRGDSIRVFAPKNYLNVYDFIL